MADYIKREDVFHALFNGEHNLYSWFEIEEKLDEIPSEDVVPREDYDRACITLNKIAEVLRDG